MFGQPFNRYAWVVNPPSDVRQYSSADNRAIGHVFSSLVAKINRLHEHKEITSIVEDVERVIERIAIYTKRNPANLSWIDYDLEDIVIMFEEMQFTEDELEIGVP